METDTGMIRIEVAYALPDRQELLVLSIPAGSSVMDAVHLSGIIERYPEIDVAGRNKVGVFGKLCKPEQVLRDGDRVEIYRPLTADPKEVRRRLAAEGRTMGRKPESSD